MKKRFRSGATLVLLTIWFLIGVSLLCYTAGRTITREFYVLAGSWAIYGTEIEVGVQASLTADQALQNNLAKAGADLLERIGYGQSAHYLIWRGFFDVFMPGLIISTISVLISLILAFWFRYGEERHNEQLLHENQLLNRQIEAIEAEQKRQMQEIEEYEGNLYHQLKTPLTSLDLCLELLASLQSEAEWQRALAGARFQTDKLSRLTRLLLREKQLASRKVRFHYELVPLEVVVEQAVLQLEPTARFRGVSLVWAPPEEECTIRCDEVWMTECIVAILDNAVEYAQSNSAVRLQLEKRPGGFTFLVRSDSRTEVANRDQLFNRFVSASPGHFGIGLHLAKSVVESLHGSISVRSDNTTVWVELYLPNLHDSRAYDVTIL